MRAPRIVPHGGYRRGLPDRQWASVGPNGEVAWERHHDGPRGAVLHIEGPPATDRYMREFGVDAGGGYNVTALSTSKYTIWLKGANIRSRQYTVEYPDWAKIRIIVDFYQVACW